MKRILSILMMVCIAFLLINCNKVSGYKRGKLTETGFESKYIDIKFTLPEGYIMATEEDMLERMGIGADIIGVEKKVVELTTVYEMMASMFTGYPSVIITVEKLLYSNITTEQYLEVLRTTLLNVDIMNYEIDNQFTSVNLAGYNYSQLSSSIPRLNVFQNYLVRKQGNRMIGFVITYTSDTEQELETLMNGFSKLTR
jgi:hypothetical protein